MTPDTATLSDFVRVLRNRARPAALTAFGVLLAMAAFVFLSPAIYQASAKLLIEQMDMPVELTGGAGAQEYVEQRLQRTRQRVLTDENVKALMERHKLYESGFETDLLEEKLAKFNENVSITPQVTGVIDPKSMRAADLTYAFDVGFKDSNPETTEKVANELQRCSSRRARPRRRKRPSARSSLRGLNPSAWRRNCVSGRAVWPSFDRLTPLASQTTG